MYVGICKCKSVSIRYLLLEMNLETTLFMFILNHDYLQPSYATLHIVQWYTSLQISVLNLWSPNFRNLNDTRMHFERENVWFTLPSLLSVRYLLILQLVKTVTDNDTLIVANDKYEANDNKITQALIITIMNMKAAHKAMYFQCIQHAVFQK